MNVTRFWLMLFLCTVTVAVVGCGGDGIERVGVSGTVSYQGQPVQEGMISFEPQGQGTPAGAIIKGGKYDATGTGAVPVGRYRVRISATVEDTANWVKDAMPVAPKKELLPAKYNRDTELTLEVASGAGEMEQNYDLK